MFTYFKFCKLSPYPMAIFFNLFCHQINKDKCFLEASSALGSIWVLHIRLLNRRKWPYVSSSATARIMPAQQIIKLNSSNNYLKINKFWPIRQNPSSLYSRQMWWWLWMGLHRIE